MEMNLKYSFKLLTSHFLLLTFAIFLLTSLTTEATVRYVSKTGLSIPPYTSWKTAADSIQECINICVFGDTIYVANGEYKEKVTMINGLSLIGAGTDSCVINTQEMATTTSFRSVIVKDTCLLRGFKIIVAYNSELGGGISGSAINSLIIFNRVTKAKYGIENGSNVTIYKNKIDNISTGIELFNSNAIVRQNFIYTNPNSQSAIIAGIYIEAFDFSYTPIIDSNYIEIEKGDGIRKSFGTRPTIKNNTLLLKGVGTYGIELLGPSDSAKVYNNKIYAIRGVEGIYPSGVQFLTLYNNYVTGNFDDQQNLRYVITLGSNHTANNNVVTNAERGVKAVGTQNLVFQYNNVWNNNDNYSGFTPDTTNLSVDPMIVNDDFTQGELDFHLQKYSPLIDAGDPNILDRDGSRSDIGLYGGPYGETYTYNDLAPRPPHNVTAVIEDGLVKLTWNKNTEADFHHYRIYRDTVSIVIYDSSKTVGQTPDTVFYDNLPPQNKAMTYYYIITAFDHQGNQSYPSEEIVVTTTGLGEQPAKGYDGYRLLSNYPNPFNPSTIIPYRLKEGGYVRLYIYDIKGELVQVLVNQWQEKGYYEVEFRPNTEERSKASSFEVPVGKTYSDIATGVYIYQIMVRNENDVPVFSDMGKMILLK
jgi:hypothetical protein